MSLPCNRVAAMAALALMVVMPVAFPDVAARALSALRLSGPVALLLLATAILTRTVRVRVGPGCGALAPTAASASPVLLPLIGGWRHRAPGGAISVSLGGCLLPCALVTYEAVTLQQQGVSLALPAVAATITAALCYSLTRPATGAAAPADVTAFVAAGAALGLAPDHAVPVACAAGTLGPLLGVELLHLQGTARLDHDHAGLGGAAAFDAILLSCLVAVWLE